MWTGPIGSGGAPVARVPGFRDVLAVRRMVLLELGPVKKGLLAVATCGNPMCVSRMCVRAISRRRLQRMTAARTNYHRSAARSAKLAAVARKRRALSDEDAIRAMVDPRPIRVVAKELGVGFSVVQKIRAGETYRFAAGSPWAGL